MDLQQLRLHDKPRTSPRTGTMPIFHPQLVQRTMDLKFELVRYKVVKRSLVNPTTHWVLDPINDRDSKGNKRPQIELSEQEIIRLRAEQHVDQVFDDAARKATPKFQS